MPPEIVVIIVIIIVIVFGGAFFSFRASVRAARSSRRLANWPRRRRLMSISWWYFAAANLLTLFAVLLVIFNKSIATRYFPASQLPLPTPINTLVTPPGAIPTPTNTPVPTNAAIPLNTVPGIPSPTPSRTPKPTDTRWPTQTPTFTATKTPVPTITPTPSQTPTPTPSPTPSLTPHPTDAQRLTPLPTSTVTATPIPAITPTRSNTPTRTPSPIPSRTPKPTDTRWPTPTPTFTATRTSVPTITPTPSNTPTRTPSPTFSLTPVPTGTPLPAPTPTSTFTPTPTHTPTRTPTRTPTNTPTQTLTATPSSTPAPQMITVYDFTANACSAIWVGGGGLLPCPGTEGDAQGLIYPLRAPQLEDGSIGQPGLLVVPRMVTNDTILGSYPAFTVQNGDRFQVVLSCQYDAKQCDIIFQLNYQIGNGPIQTLLMVRERYEGAYSNIDVDLSSLAGKDVKFMFIVFANGSSVGDRGIWSGSKIMRVGNSITPAPIVTGTSAVPTSMIAGPSPTISPTSCNRAAFVADVTIPDGTILEANKAFTKTWRLKNVGTCTWTTAYRVFFTGGDQLTAPSSVNLPSNVAPGQTVDVSVEMVAPGTAGHYKGYWVLRSATGAIFGVGPEYNNPFWVDIKVETNAWNTSSSVFVNVFSDWNTVHLSCLTVVPLFCIPKRITMDQPVKPTYHHFAGMTINRSSI